MLMDEEETPTKICAGCGYVITSKYLSLNGEDWHPPCVLCVECSAPVFTGDTPNKVHAQDNKIYCQECVTQLFQVCADCGQPAKKYVKALGKIWHTFHFKCASCETILDTYAEVNGEAFCQPCHQRMSAKSFTKAKRRSFGTEKKDASAKPAWASKPKVTAASAAPKSALDVMHKSWFQNGLKPKAQSPTPPSPTPGSTPSSPLFAPSHTTTSNGTRNEPSSRPYSPTPSHPTSPTIPKAYVPSPAAANAKPPQRSVPPLSSASSLAQQRPPWAKAPDEAAAKPKANTWQAPAPRTQVSSPSPPFGQSNLKPVNRNIASPPPTTPSYNRSGATSPPVNGNGAGYTNINFSKNVSSPKESGGVRNRKVDDNQIPHGAVNVSDILDAILRPLTEEEIGSMAAQSFALLAEIHNKGELHNNLKHKTIYINSSGMVYFVKHDGEDDSKVGGSSIKFKAPESALSIASDIYSLGVALWTSADYLLDEEEEPALSADFCDFIGMMTDDFPENRPPIKALIPHVERYKDMSPSYLAALIKEVERKRLLRAEITEVTEKKQRQLGKVLLDEIEKGVHLKKVVIDPNYKAVKQMNPHEMMCHAIKFFSSNHLRHVNLETLPQREQKMNPRERLMQALKAKKNLKRALVVAGIDINTLIAPVPNHPTYGTIFRDISGLFTVSKVTTAVALQICKRFTGDPPDYFVATPTDAGVFFASLVGEYFNRGVIVLQNAGRLPRKMEKYSCNYDTLGYVSHALELQLQKGLVKEGTRVVLIDEMLVNGGILEAARIILRDTGAKVKEVICIVELEGFGGRQKIKNFDCNVHAMYTFNDNQQEQHRPSNNANNANQ